MSTVITIFIGVLLLTAVILIYDYLKSLLQKRLEQRERFLQEEKEQEYIKRMEQLRQKLILAEVLRQAKLSGDEKIIDIVLNHPDDYNGPMPQEWDNGYFSSIYPERLLIMNIAGINYRGSLKTYVGDFNGVLVPEPKNDFDPNAIMIKCEDGKHLGYIAENLTEDVRDFIGHPDAENDTKWRHRITGHIDEREDDDELDEHDRPRKYYTGYINITKE